MAGKKYKTAPVVSDKMPSGIPYIIGNEAAERFSFYGMKGILVVFMTKNLLDASGNLNGMGENEAIAWAHNFNTAVYFFPVLGAIISDWLFGKYRTIMSLSLLYCVGHGILACLEIEGTGLDPREILFWGLATISLGAGGIKPCVSAHVGDQFGSKNQHLISKVFVWFYFSINFGSTLAMIAMPWILDSFGPGWAFGVPGILMAIATLAFWMGRNKFVHIPPTGNSFFKETFTLEGRRAIFNLIPLYIFIAVFWALFDQTSSAWVLQANHMDRVMIDTTIGGQDFYWKMLPAQMQSINPILVMVFIPVFSFIVYPFLGKFFKVTPLRKIGLGLFLTVPAFMIPGWLETRIQAGESPHIMWQAVAYILMTGAEIMVSITALEFSYTQAPKKIKSFIMGLYLLSVAVGNKFTAIVNDYIADQKSEGSTFLDGATYYWFFTGVMAVTAVIYVGFSQFYKGSSYVQDDGSGGVVEDAHA